MISSWTRYALDIGAFSRLFKEFPDYDDCFWSSSYARITIYKLISHWLGGKRCIPSSREQWSQIDPTSKIKEKFSFKKNLIVFLQWNVNPSRHISEVSIFLSMLSESNITWLSAFNAVFQRSSLQREILVSAAATRYCLDTHNCNNLAIFS